MLIKDEWLSQYFSGGAYRYDAPWDALEFPKGFIFSKVPMENSESTKKLLSYGFTPVETLVHLNQKNKITLNQETCSFVSSNDKEQVIEIAKDAFVFSRFYQDPNITKDTASRIKKDWVENYFFHKRGSNMVVSREENKIFGFMLLLDKTIDLIAVAPEQARKGIASSMIAFANEHIGLLSAGTQLSNKPSLGMYEKAGFSSETSYTILHKHVDERSE